MFKMEVVTQDYYSATSGYIATAELIFSTSEGSSFTAGFGTAGGNFLGTATVSSHCPLQGGWSRECFAIQQNSSTSYTFYIFLLNAPGRGMFRVTTNTLDTFAYTGVPSFMSGTWIKPDQNSRVTAADVGLGSVNNTADADKPVSTAQAAAIANQTSPTINNPTIAGTLAGTSTANFYQAFATNGFFCRTGSLTTTTTLQTIYNCLAAGNQRRGFALVQAGTPNNSNGIYFFDATNTTNVYLSVIARNGNAPSSVLLGSNNAGTLALTVSITSAGLLQVSTSASGTTVWSLFFL